MIGERKATKRRCDLLLLLLVDGPMQTRERVDYLLRCGTKYVLCLILCITVYCRRRGNKCLVLKSGVRVAKKLWQHRTITATTLQRFLKGQRMIRLVLSSDFSHTWLHLRHRQKTLLAAVVHCTFIGRRPQWVEETVLSVFPLLRRYSTRNWAWHR